MTTKGQMKSTSWQGESQAFGAGSNPHTSVGCACLHFSYTITWFYSLILYLSFTLIPATVFANKYAAIHSKFSSSLSCLWPKLHCVSCSLSRIMQCCLIICSNATWQWILRVSKNLRVSRHIQIWSVTGGLPKVWWARQEPCSCRGPFFPKNSLTTPV